MFFARAGSFLLHLVWKQSGLALPACSPPPLGRARLGNFEQMSPSPVSDTSKIFLLNHYLQIGGGRMGRGVIAKYVKYGLGCLCMYLPQFPQKRGIFFFFSQSKIERVGGERREAAKSQV